MKVYTLTIVYDEEKEEIQYVSEELEGETEALLKEYAEVDLGTYLDEDEDEFVKGCYIVGKA